MKLYATTTSERASKGQGGNKEIVIDLTIDPILRKTVGRIVMQANENKGFLTAGTDYIIKYYPVGGIGYQVLYEAKIEHTIKGKQKKDEISAPRRADWIDDGKDDTY